MKAHRILGLLLLASPLTLLAAAPADAPPGTSALCKDGSYYQGEKKGACKEHRGVKDWYGSAAATAPAAPTAKTTATPPAVAPAPAPKPAAVAKTAPAPAPAPAATPDRKPPQPAAKAAAGGGAGKVWINANSKVYHCPGDRWYGKTKDGQYVSEADAKAQGYKGPRGKDCS